MLSTGIPELKQPEDLQWIRIALRPDLDDEGTCLDIVSVQSFSLVYVFIFLCVCSLWQALVNISEN